MKSRLLVYILFVTAAVLAVAGLIQLGGAWFPLQGVEVVSPAERSSGALAQMLDNARRSSAASHSSADCHPARGTRVRQFCAPSGTTAGDRRNRGRRAAGSIAARMGGAGRERISVSERVDADPAAAQSDRGAAVHVRRGRGARTLLPAREGPCGGCRQPLQHHHPVHARRVAVAGALHAVRAAGRAVPCLCAVLRHRHEHHGLPGPGAHPGRTPPDAHAVGNDRHHVRGG